MTLEYMIAHPKETTYMDTEIAPSRGELIDQARDYYKNNRKSEYLVMVKTGTLEATCEAKAKQTEEYAQDLIKSGEHFGPAWIRARRAIILETETD
jgi:hypothetical protein